MATTKGPLISLEGSGSILRTMVFSTWKGRAYTKFSTKPTNPKSASQLANRAMLRFLATSFGSLSAANIATWTDLANQANLSTYNAWLSYNMERWSRYLFPTKAEPAAEARASGEINSADATARNRTILVHLNMGEFNFNWAYHLHRSTTPGFTPSLANTIRIGLWESSGDNDLYWSDGPLPLDTYYYRVSTFSDDGDDEGLFTTEFNATLS